MKYTEFEIIGTNAITVKYNCSECGKENLSDMISVPEEHFLLDGPEYIKRNYEASTTCKFCGKLHEIFLERRTGYGCFGITGAEEVANDIEVTPYKSNDFKRQEDQINAIMATMNALSTFTREIGNIRMLNESVGIDEKLERPYRQLLFAAVITCMEVYLS
jgi:hypothetical protein